jgi:iron complex transport system substrate-binding protein
VNRRIFGAVTALIVLGGSAAACGDGSPSSSTDRSAESTTSGGDGGPVVIRHHYGSTTLDATPRRIVSLDNQWTDVLLSLDAPLVGAALDPTIDGGRFPWQHVPDDVEDIAVTDAIPYEAVAALRPDLIVITWGAEHESDYDKLSQIAPTIPLLGDQEVDHGRTSPPRPARCSVGRTGPPS